MVEVQFKHRATGESEYLLLRALPPATERDFGRSARHLISLDDAQGIAHEILQGRRGGIHGDYDWRVLD